jgi:hypothetical protein
MLEGAAGRLRILLARRSLPCRGLRRNRGQAVGRLAFESTYTDYFLTIDLFSWSSYRAYAMNAVTSATEGPGWWPLKGLSHDR